MPNPNSLAADMVNAPPHYTAGGVECIDAIEAALGPEQFVGFLRGQVLKYTWRTGKKSEHAQDVRKSIWYAERLAKCLEKTKPV